jgi:RNA polymerase subunit RPABC4/transcription elongation factor Spt4
MSAKMIKCKVCGADIASNSKSCPNCGAKNKKPVYKKWWFWLIIVVLLICIISSAGNSGSEKDTTSVQVTSTESKESSKDSGSSEAAASAAEDSTAAESSEETDNRIYPGNTLTTSKLSIDYLECGEYETEEYFEASEGNKVIYLTFEAENIGDSDTLFSAYDFECYADGYSCDNYWYADSVSATLSAGRKATGSIYFEVPESAEDIEIEYDVSYWTNEKAVFVYQP